MHLAIHIIIQILPYAIYISVKVCLYEVPFVKYVLHALYGQFYAFPILSQNGNDKSWTALCGL